MKNETEKKRSRENETVRTKGGRERGINSINDICKSRSESFFYVHLKLYNVYVYMYVYVYVRVCLCVYACVCVRTVKL